MEKNFTELSEIYLKSNAMGRQDGALKADTHQRLSILFLSEHFKVTTEVAKKILYKKEKPLWKMIRESTLPLTDYLDEVIGFPLNMAPNYKRLTPKFENEFKRLANDFIDDHVSIMTTTELKKVLDEITSYKFSYMYHALTSYDFDFVDGDAEKKELSMISVIGDVVDVKANQYFGCSYVLKTFDGQVINK